MLQTPYGDHYSTYFTGIVNITDHLSLSLPPSLALPLPPLSLSLPPPAVEAALRGEETPSRVDSFSVSFNTISEHPPPLPNTPRPRPPLPHVLPSSSDDSFSSSRPKGHPSHSPHSHTHRALPAPPPVNRTKELAVSGTSGRSVSPNAGFTRSGENPPPLPPNRPGSPRGSTSSSRRPPPPRRPQQIGRAHV